MSDTTEDGPSQYSVQAKTCIKGEAFFESMIADYAIPHHVTGHKDIGLDYICEWTHGSYPAGFLFGVQIKSYTVDDKNRPKADGVEARLNGLKRFQISNSNLQIKPKTINYWKGLGLPFYLFVVARSKENVESKERLDLYYKRFTTVLTKDEPQEKLCYYQVNRELKFLAFEDEQGRQGFTRDLYIDLMRWQYFNGNIAYINPRRLGLMQFPDGESRVFRDLFREYKDRVCETYAKTKKFLEEECGDCGA